MSSNIKTVTEPFQLLHLSVRFVSHDQWLTTHVHPDWTIKQVKLWMLSKCFNITSQIQITYDDSQPYLNYVPDQGKANFPTIRKPAPRYRSTSPVTFAPHLTALNLFEDEDDDFIEISSILEKMPPITHPPPPRSESSIVPDPTTRSFNTDATSYTLLRFSTGQILEDDYPIWSYNISNYELLELRSHRPVQVFPPQFEGTWQLSTPHAKLSVPGTSFPILNRASISEYILPYWEGPVCALRAVWKDDGETTTSPTLEWRGQRVVVIQNDIFSIYNTRRRLREAYPLTSLMSLSGVESFASRGGYDSRQTLCIKFRSRIHPESRQEDKMSEYISNDQTLLRLREQAIEILVTVEVYVHRDQPKPTPFYDLNSLGGLGVRVRVWVSVDVSVQYDDTLPDAEWNMSSNVHPTERETITTKIWAGDQDLNSAYPDTHPQHEIPDSEEAPTEEWVILDVGTDLAFQSILRVLHRYLQFPSDSSFLGEFGSNSETPTPTGSLTPTHTTPNEPHTLPDLKFQDFRWSVKNLPSYDDDNSSAPGVFYSSETPTQSHLSVPSTVFSSGSIHIPPETLSLPYPEWRTMVVERAQRVSMGAMWKPMEYLQGWSEFVGDENEEEDNLFGNKRSEELPPNPLSDMESLYPLHHRQSMSALNSNLSLDTTKLLGSEDGGEESDTEWQGWVWDLGRRKSKE